jgi:hypothetical protein
MEQKLHEEAEKILKKIMEEKTFANNIDGVYKLIKIKNMTKEDDNMYGNYGGRRAGYDSYGRYGDYGAGSYGEYGRGSYGRRGYDTKYRGDEELDRMAGEYGRYMESRSRYGAGEESDKAFHFMAKALGEYLDFLHEEADTPQKKQMLNETLQRSMM